MKTATVSVQGNQIGIFWQVITKFQPQSMAEQRGQTRIMHELGLDVIEAKLLADPEKPVEMSKESVDCVISEAGYLYLCSQWDHLKDIFPAGVNADGLPILAGLPNIWSRILAPIFNQLDEAFKLGDYTEDKPVEAKP